MKVQAIKTRLLRRSALVAELHPDKTRQIEMQLEEQATRTVSALLKCPPPPLPKVKCTLGRRKPYIYIDPTECVAFDCSFVGATTVKCWNGPRAIALVNPIPRKKKEKRSTRVCEFESPHAAFSMATAVQ